MGSMWDKAPVTQTIARRLQGMIRSGELKAGQKLPSQRILSERLSVSRPTLREALLTLETLGLVQTLPARGTFVMAPDTAKPPQTAWRYDDAYELREVFQSRLLIESEICRLAAGAMTSTTLVRLETACTAFAESWEAEDLVAHAQADLEFHQAIARSCPNRMLATIYDTARQLLAETQRQPIPNTARGRMVQSIAEHYEILDALQSADGERAEKAMRVHIRNTAHCAGIIL